MKKKLLFDLLMAQPDGNVKFHGGGEYIKKILKEILDKYLDRIELTVFYDKDKFMDDWLQIELSAKSICCLDVKDFHEVRNLLSKGNFDTFYSGLPYLYTRQEIPEWVYAIGTFHGLRVLECPHDDGREYMYGLGIKAHAKHRVRTLLTEYSDDFRQRRISKTLAAYRKSLEAFNLVICVSEHSEYTLRNFFPEVKQVTTCYSPMKESLLVDNIASSYGEFILLVSADRWIKNSSRAVEAIDELYSRGHLEGVNVVLTGSLPKRVRQRLRYAERFTELGYVSSSELEELYATCRVFLYPTLNEGFGYPPLEAMKYGRTCVVSAVCSVPEICGSAVYYANPYDVTEIENRILQAFAKPIDKAVIEKRLKEVGARQQSDLSKLCELIVKGDMQE